jgi:hypothetical protein
MPPPNGNARSPRPSRRSGSLISISRATAVWENDAGAYGTFRFDVAHEIVEIEFNARFCDVATSTSQF